jgi:hypothetical protein
MLARSTLKRVPGAGAGERWGGGGAEEPGGEDGGGDGTGDHGILLGVLMGWPQAWHRDWLVKFSDMGMAALAMGLCRWQA